MKKFPVWYSVGFLHGQQFTLALCFALYSTFDMLDRKWFHGFTGYSCALIFMGIFWLDRRQKRNFISEDR